MAALPSFKDLTKAINAFLPTAILPLPDDLVELIDGYLRKHEKFEESIADKLHDELLSIYHKQVEGFPSRYASFLNILRRFRPLIGQPAKVLQWWDLLLPLLDHLNSERDVASEIQALLLDTLTADDSDDPDNPLGGTAIPLAEKLLSLWLDECRDAAKTEDALENLKEKQFRHTIITYGKKRPKDFMTVLDKFMVKSRSRIPTLHLMEDFIRSQPPHLHLILKTPLFGTLLNCLQVDTSTTTVCLALTVVTMLLPHFPSTLVPYLPTLFNIYARLLFWDRELPSAESTEVVKANQRLSPSVSAWEEKVYSSDFDDTSIPHLMNYFTILYGLYPINFMDYIRKPQRYLRHAEVPDPDDIEVQPTEIRHASEQFRQCHLLHENFYTLTIDSEKTDFGRWIKSEPAEVFVNCFALRQDTSLSDELHSRFDVLEATTDLPKDGKDHGRPGSAILSGSIVAWPQREGWDQSGDIELQGGRHLRPAVLRHSSRSSRSLRDSASIRASGSDGDILPAAGHLPSVGSQTQLQDLINSNKAIKSAVGQSLATDSAASLPLSHQESTPEKFASHLQHALSPANVSLSTFESHDVQVRHLYRQILLLQNDLTFERFMKQQHLTHMGELRRRQFREAASEAEMQNLIMANRHLKQRLEEAKKTEIQVKKESEKSRTLSKKWEADLSTKLRTLREEQKKWNVERDALKRDLETAKKEADQLRALVCEAEVRELAYKQSIQEVEANGKELTTLKKELERLTISERNFQAKEIEHQAALTQATEADQQVEIARMKLDATYKELQELHKTYQAQIAELSTKLQDALEDGPNRVSDELKALVESALAASRAQQAELEERVTTLTKEKSTLNAKILELQVSLSLSSDHDTQGSMVPDIGEAKTSQDSGSRLDPPTRRHRELSDSEALHPTSYNATPQLELQRARSSSPAGTSASGSVRKISAQERYHGRGEQKTPSRSDFDANFVAGGVQNTGKKDKKDKKDDKDKKKTTGLRGIRNFV